MEFQRRGVVIVTLTLLAASVLFTACKSDNMDGGAGGNEDAHASDARANDDAQPQSHPDAAVNGDANPSDAAPVLDTGIFPDASDTHDATTGDARNADATPGDTGTSTAGDAGFFCDLGLDVQGLTVPNGFCIRQFATVACPRKIDFAPNGDLFAASPSEFTPGNAPQGLGAIVVLPDDNHDGRADSTLMYAQGLTSVHGILFRRSHTEFVYTVSDGVFSVPYHSGDRTISTMTPTMIADLSNPGVQRWTHTVAESTDGTLYVSRGQFDSNSCPTDLRYGSILKIGPGAAMNGDVIVTGMRDPMYTRCSPWGPCFGAELSGDGWDSMGGFEKLFIFHAGDNLGYPCCIDRNHPNTDITPVPDCSQVTLSITSFRLHDTPFGFDWDANNRWPAPYTGALFVAQHGSFGLWVGAGVSWAPIDPTTHYPTATSQLFAQGWGSSVGSVTGRPTDAVFAPDGRLFIADDQGGAIYWIAPRTLRR